MDKTEEFWDKASKNYDATEERFEPIHSRAREKAKEHLKASDIVLDYGCGTGTKSCELADQVTQILAIDISAEMIELAKEKGAANSIENIRFEQATIFDEELEAGSFDVVMAFNMLHTIPDPQGIVRRIGELLKPDGLFISVTPCMADKKSFLVSLQINIFRILTKLGLVPITFEFYKNSDVDDLIGSSGHFQTVDAESIFSGATSYFVAARKSGH